MVISCAYLFIYKRSVIIFYKPVYQLAGVGQEEEVFIMCKASYSFTYSSQYSYHVYGPDLCHGGEV